jgi:hypothetical protein
MTTTLRYPHIDPALWPDGWGRYDFTCTACDRRVANDHAPVGADRRCGTCRDHGHTFPLPGRNCC